MAASTIAVRPSAIDIARATAAQKRVFEARQDVGRGEVVDPDDQLLLRPREKVPKRRPSSIWARIADDGQRVRYRIERGRGWAIGNLRFCRPVRRRRNSLRGRCKRMLEGEIGSVLLDAGALLQGRVDPRLGCLQAL